MARRHPKRSVTRDIRTRRPLHPGRLPDELDATTWRIGAVPVVEGGRLVGLLTETDVLAAFRAGIAPRVRPVRALRRARAGGDYDHGFPAPVNGDAWQDNGAGS